MEDCHLSTVLTEIHLILHNQQGTGQRTACYQTTWSKCKQLSQLHWYSVSAWIFISCQPHWVTSVCIMHSKFFESFGISSKLTQVIIHKFVSFTFTLLTMLTTIHLIYQYQCTITHVKIHKNQSAIYLSMHKNPCFGTCLNSVGTHMGTC